MCVVVVVVVVLESLDGGYTLSKRARSTPLAAGYRDSVVGGGLVRCKM